MNILTFKLHKNITANLSETNTQQKKKNRRKKKQIKKKNQINKKKPKTKYQKKKTNKNKQTKLTSTQKLKETKHLKNEIRQNIYHYINYPNANIKVNTCSNFRYFLNFVHIFSRKKSFLLSEIIDLTIYKPQKE